MIDYYYFDVLMQFDQSPPELLPVFVKGKINLELQSVYGEIGGHTNVDLLKFNNKTGRLILRVPTDFYKKLRFVLTLLSDFQGIPCTYKVLQCSPILLSLLKTHPVGDQE